MSAKEPLVATRPHVENAHGSGSLNLYLRGMGVSATLAINERNRQLRNEGRFIYNFGLGQSPFPVPDSVVEALRRSAAEKDYLPVNGLPELREAVASFHRRFDQFDATAEGVIVGPGSKELMFLVQLAFYGEILIPTPCWVSYLPQARILGRRVSLLHTNFESDWKITAEQLEESLEAVNDRSRPRLLVLNYPANPTGLTYSATELKEIAEVADRFELIVLSDEIYGQLHHGADHISIARYYPERTIVSSGLSKWCGAGGWRLGTFCFPPELGWLHEALAAAASETFTSVCTPVQYAAVEAFRCGAEVESYLQRVRSILGALGRRCTTLLAEAGIRVTPPDGAFYLFLDFSPFAETFKRQGISNGAAVCERLLEDTGVAVLPGVSFTRSRGELTARLAYVDFDGQAALQACADSPANRSLSDSFLEQHCMQVVEGVGRIAEWVQGPHRIEPAPS